MTPEKNNEKNSSPQKELKNNKFAGFKNKIRNYVAAGLALWGAAEMQGQTTDKQQPNTYNSLVTELDTNDDASVIASNVQGKIAQITRSWRQNEDTQFLNAVININGNANVPASVDAAGTLGSIVMEYRKWVKNEAPYDTGNGRPNSADDRVTYAYQLNFDPGVGVGVALGGGENYSTIAYSNLVLDPSYNFSNIVYQQETGHCFGLSSNDASEFSAMADVFNDGTYTFPDDVRAAMADADATGFSSNAMASSADKRTDIVLDDDNVWRVYNEYYAGTNPTIYRAIPEDMAITIDGTTPALDEINNRVKIGGPIHDRVKLMPVPANIDIQFKTPDVTIDGNIITFTDLITDNIAVTNPYNNIDDKIEVFAYIDTNTANGSQIPRNINGISRLMVGFTISAANPSVDLTYFLNDHALDISNLDFKIRNTNQNGMSLVANETVLAVANQELAGFKMYPNPTTGIVTIENKNGYEISTVEILDKTGKEIYKLNGSQQINLENLADGLYFIRITDKNGAYHNTKIIKK